MQTHTVHTHTVSAASTDACRSRALLELMDGSNKCREVLHWWKLWCFVFFCHALIRPCPDNSTTPWSFINSSYVLALNTNNIWWSLPQACSEPPKPALSLSLLSACFASLSSFDTVASEWGHLIQHQVDCPVQCILPCMCVLSWYNYWFWVLVLLHFHWNFFPPRMHQMHHHNTGAETSGIWTQSIWFTWIHCYYVLFRILCRCNIAWNAQPDFSCASICIRPLIIWLMNLFE